MANLEQHQAPANDNVAKAAASTESSALSNQFASMVGPSSSEQNAVKPAPAEQSASVAKLGFPGLEITNSAASTDKTTPAAASTDKTAPAAAPAAGSDSTQPLNPTQITQEAQRLEGIANQYMTTSGSDEANAFQSWQSEMTALTQHGMGSVAKVFQQINKDEKGNQGYVEASEPWIYAKNGQAIMFTNTHKNLMSFPSETGVLSAGAGLNGASYQQENPLK